MAIVSGPELDKIRDELVEWYNTTRQWLIGELTNDYPYGTIKVSPEEQYSKYLSMLPEDFLRMRAALMNVHRGSPNALDKVDQDILRYRNRMESIGRRLGYA